MTRYQVPREEASINLIIISETGVLFFDIITFVKDSNYSINFNYKNNWKLDDSDEDW